MMQTVGVECLQQGTCLTQCTYVEELDDCSSDFCTIHKGSWWSSGRARCMPRVGANESLEGWERLKQRTRENAEWVYDSGCVGTCEDSWKFVQRNLHLANEL